MPSAASLAATFVAGLLSFLAPCTLPLLPGWLAYLSGVAAGDLADPARRGGYRGRLLGTTLLYVAGFGHFPKLLELSPVSSEVRW